MIAFGTASDAVGCGVRIQQALTGQRRGRVRVRIGIHKGEAVHRDGDLFGRNVALAARVASAAAGGEILVSEPVRDAITDEPVEFGVGRDVELKGLPGACLYAVRWSTG